MTDYAIIPRRRKYLVVETDERGASALVERYADEKAALDRLRVLKHLSGQLYLYGLERQESATSRLSDIPRQKFCLVE